MSKIRINSYYYPPEIEKQLLSAIAEKNREKVTSILEGLLDKNLNELHIDTKALNEFKFSLVSTIQRAGQQMNSSINEIFSEDYIPAPEMKMTESNEAFADKVFKMFNLLIKDKPAPVEEVDPKIHKAMIYVLENYMKDISLSDISNELGVSVFNVSRLFKKHLNINFKDYLNQHRIKIAKAILVENNKMKISDISAVVGFNNVETFNRVFKKYEGVSPGGFIRRENIK